MSLKNKGILSLIAFLLLIVTSSAIYAWYKERNKPPVSTTEYIKVPEIKEVVKIQRVEVPGPERVVTVEKLKVVEKLKLPEWFAKDKDEQAIATGVAQPYEGETNVVATLNTKTGVGGLIMKQEPLSLVGFINEKELYGKVGYTSNREIETVVGGRWLFARVGKIKFGAYAESGIRFETDENENNFNGQAVAGLMITY
ncbi:MAG: hypothetical protein WC979_09530 [Candidatus Pacearchaeota archaeon]|jgi:hypothetical protein